MKSDAIGQWVMDAKGGDDDAFGRLVQTYWSRVVVAIESVVGDFHAAQDVAQEAFIRAHRSLGRLDQGEQFLKWVLRIAKNAALDRVRVTRFRGEVELDESRDIAAAMVRDGGGRPDENHMWAAVADLPERERRLFMLRYARGLTQEEIAVECGISVAGVKVGLHRGRRRVGEMLRRLDLEGE